MVDELGGVVDELVTVDCAVDAGVDVVFAVAVDERDVFVFSADVPLVIATTAVPELAGHSSTYVVSSTPEPTEALFVGNSREIPPCPFETTEIVRVCKALVLVDELTVGAKIFEVPAAVMLGTLEVEDAVVELT